jgi:hypothetical protein
MNWKKWILFSVVLNVTLAGVAAYLHWHRADTTPPPVQLPLPSRTRSIRETTHSEPVADPRLSEPAAKPFDWAQLESADLRAYCARLRAVGCPEKTIVDILLPIIDESYGNRLRPLNENVPGAFWISGSQRRAAMRQRDMATVEIQKEKTALIQELFGRLIDSEALQVWRDGLGFGLFLGFLPEGKPEQVLCLAAQFAYQSREIHRFAQYILTPEDVGQLSQLYDQGRHGIASILTPSEMEELELRMTAIGAMSVLQESVMGLEVTGTEIRNLLANLIHTGNAPLRNSIMDINPTKEEKDKLRQLIETQMRPILGDARFTHYQRMQDPTYQGIYRFGEQHDLPSPLVSQVYAVCLVGQDEANRIHKNQALTPMQRDESLAQAQQAWEEALRGLLGNKVFEELKKGRQP